ncbi:MAG: zinc ribbon domain-containing protein [Acidobacteriota bacterium]|nr:zinc ribbon domain-containing protein [Acidobacteriota bacterium]
MPLYEYECTVCHKRTERIQKFSDPELTECPHCQGHLERVLSAPAVSFKGGGWYADLYSSAGAKGSKAAAGATSESSSGSSTTASSTPAAPAAAPASAASSSSSSTTK